MRELDCRSCGAHIKIDSKEDLAYCPYCGATFDMYDKRILNKTVKVDETESKRIDAKYQLELEKLKNKKREQKIVLILFAISAILCVAFGYRYKLTEDEMDGVFMLMFLFFAMVPLIIFINITGSNDKSEDY